MLVPWVKILNFLSLGIAEIEEFFELSIYTEVVLLKIFLKSLNYGSTANIEEVMKFYNPGDKTFETDFSSMQHGRLQSDVKTLIQIIGSRTNPPDINLRTKPPWTRTPLARNPHSFQKFYNFCFWNELWKRNLNLIFSSKIHKTHVYKVVHGWHNLMVGWWFLKQPFWVV